MPFPLAQNFQIVLKVGCGFMAGRRKSERERDRETETVTETEETGGTGEGTLEEKSPGVHL